MHAVHVLNLFPLSFFIQDHQNILLSASVFVEPACPMYSSSLTCIVSSSGATILSPAVFKPKRTVIQLKTEESISEALFFVYF